MILLVLLLVCLLALTRCLWHFCTRNRRRRDALVKVKVKELNSPLSSPQSSPKPGPGKSPNLNPFEKLRPEPIHSPADYASLSPTDSNIQRQRKELQELFKVDSAAARPAPPDSAFVQQALGSEKRVSFHHAQNDSKLGASEDNVQPPAEPVLEKRRTLDDKRVPVLQGNGAKYPKKDQEKTYGTQNLKEEKTSKHPMRDLLHQNLMLIQPEKPFSADMFPKVPEDKDDENSDTSDEHKQRKKAERQRRREMRKQMDKNRPPSPEHVSKELLIPAKPAEPVIATYVPIERCLSAKSFGSPLTTSQMGHTLHRSASLSSVSKRNVSFIDPLPPNQVKPMKKKRSKKKKKKKDSSKKSISESNLSHSHNHKDDKQHDIKHKKYS